MAGCETDLKLPRRLRSDFFAAVCMSEGSKGARESPSMLLSSCFRFEVCH